MRAALLLLLAGCQIPDFTYPPGPPVIERFEVIPFELMRGDTATIEWKVSGADSIMLHGAGEPQPIPSQGTLPLILDRSAELELVATGAGGTSRARAEARINELEEVQILRFEVTPSLVEPDDPVRVVWRTEHSTRVVVRISSGETLIDSAPASGTLVFRPEHDVTVELVAEGWPSPKRALHAVRADPDQPSILYFVAQPTIAPLGTDVSLEWRVDSIDRVRILDLIDTSYTVVIDESPASEAGFLTLRPEAGAHTYWLEASNSEGVAAESAKLFVIDQTPPAILDFTVTPTITGPGGDLIIRWDTRFADRVVLLENSLFQPISGAASDVFVKQRVPFDTLTYELIAQNTILPVEDHEIRTVTVDPALPAFEVLGVYPADFAEPGGIVEVFWRTNNADQISISTDFGELLHTDVANEGLFDFTPDHDLQLIVTAENGRGRTTGYLAVRILSAPQVLSFSADTSIVRLSRPFTLTWTSAFADGGELQFAPSFVQVPPNGSRRLYGNLFGFSAAILDLFNDRAVTSTAIGITVIDGATGPVEVEPNDTESFAGGPYFTFPGSVSGEVSDGDVDLLELVMPLGDRLTLDTAPVGGCAGGVALEIYEIDRDIGPLGPRLVIDDPGLCAAADPLTEPTLASLVPPVYVALRLPSGAPPGSPSAYLLSFSSEAGICRDGLVDLIEECDDGNVTSGDGCDSSCKLEGLSENEPNDVSAASIPIDAPIRSFLGWEDIDRFRFEIGPADQGARSILLESPTTGSCLLDAELVLYDDAGVLLDRDDNGGLGCPMLSGPTTILTQGVYLLEVRPGRGVTLPRKGRYVFSVR